MEDIRSVRLPGNPLTFKVLMIGHRQMGLLDHGDALWYAPLLLVASPIL